MKNSSQFQADCYLVPTGDLFYLAMYGHGQLIRAALPHPQITFFMHCEALLVSGWSIRIPSLCWEAGKGASGESAASA